MQLFYNYSHSNHNNIDYGFKSKYPLYGLRKNCPCVMCRGGHDQMQNFEPEAFFLENPPRMNMEAAPASDQTITAATL